MDNRIKEVAERIRALREIMELSREEMAACTGTTLEQYSELEEGRADFSFTFIYNVPTVSALTSPTCSRAPLRP